MPANSKVRAVNMSCERARRLVRITTETGRAPSGWVYLNPAGCEGVIVRRRDRARVVARNYRLPKGAAGVRTIIYRGCKS